MKVGDIVQIKNKSELKIQRSRLITPTGASFLLSSNTVFGEKEKIIGINGDNILLEGRVYWIHSCMISEVKNTDYLPPLREFKSEIQQWIDNRDTLSQEKVKKVFETILEDHNL